MKIENTGGSSAPSNNNKDAVHPAKVAENFVDQRIQSVTIFESGSAILEGGDSLVIQRIIFGWDGQVFPLRTLPVSLGMRSWRMKGSVLMPQKGIYR